MPFVIQTGRTALIYSHNWIAFQIDGKRMAGMKLTDEQKQALAEALTVKSSIAADRP